MLQLENIAAAARIKTLPGPFLQSMDGMETPMIRLGRATEVFICSRSAYRIDKQ
jgi:hypothetical protein